VERIASELLLHPRTTAEVRRIWLGYLGQCDAGLGRALAARLAAPAAL
jgi:catalase